jgi:signal transduction histidine kinase
MSLRARLTLLMVGMVIALFIVLLAIQLNSLASMWLAHTEERATSTAQFVKNYVTERVNERSMQLGPEARGTAARIEFWRSVIATDTELPDLLSRTLAQTRSIVEISVAGAGGKILACSNPLKVGTQMSGRNPLKKLLDLGPFDRFLAILGGSVDYETKVDLGVTGQKEPVFTIQVLVSSVLMRDAVLPEIRNTALASLPLLIFSVLFAWLAAQIALRPLEGISKTIDRIASGQEESAAHGVSSPRELATVQEKLRLLGEQFRGAQMGATQLRGNVEQLLEKLEEAIFLFGPGGRLVVCGEPASRLLHRSRGEIIGRTAAELFPTALPAGAAIDRALLSRRPLRDAVVGRLILNLDFLPDGSMLLRARDAEGRQMVENQLSLSSRLAAISRLTGGVAHEIKNPLNSITLRLELLRSRVLPDVPEAIDELDVISQEITRLDRVVRTFLDFTRPVELKTEDLDLAKLTSELVELIRPEAERNQVQMDIRGLDSPAPMSGDADLLKQALMNVLRNALEAMPQGGRLGVNLREEEGEEVLEISDTGPGIPAASREKIFQLYYSTKAKGTGIGLAMAFRAAQLHNGAIEVGGEEGSGATFRLRFPAGSGGERP